MAHFQSLNDDQIEWEEVKSANGNTFQIGRPKSDGKDNTITKDVNVASKQNFGIQVWWPVENGWKDVTGEIKDDGGIQRYNLSNNNGKWGYNWILEFNNTENYDFYFYDRTGDCYRCDCYRRGDHYVCYNSNRPTIVFVTGK